MNKYTVSNMITLSSADTEIILHRFPNIELSYEITLHNKISQEYQVCIAMPYAKKIFVWIAFFQERPACFILELNRNKKIISASIANISFSEDLAIGTILYGSLLDNNYSVVIEDIIMFKGLHTRKLPFGEKLGFIQQFLEKCKTNKRTDIHFSLPIIVPSENEATLSNRAAYPVHHIQYRSLTHILTYLNVAKTSIYNRPTTNNISTTISSNLNSSVSPVIPVLLRELCDFTKPHYRELCNFHITADLQYDIYNLFVFGKNGSLVLYDIAYIPDYKTSVFMNCIFRTIRENDNLDYIEESDDEDTFQDISYDKYVNLNKNVRMECKFNFKFKRWTPIRIIHEHLPRIVHLNQLIRYRSIARIG
jgi:hypothetical protein